MARLTLGDAVSGTQWMSDHITLRGSLHNTDLDFGRVPEEKTLQTGERECPDERVEEG